jgi:AraC family transcriptional regulator
MADQALQRGGPQPLSEFDGRIPVTACTAKATVAEVVFEPRQQIVLHAHERARICVVLSGAWEEGRARRSTIASTGTAYYLPPGTAHANTFGPTESRCLRIEFDPAMHEAEGGCRSASWSQPWERGAGAIPWAGFRLHARLRSQSTTQLDVDEFLQVCVEGAAHLGGARRGAPPRWLQRVREALEEAIACPPSLAELSRVVEVHPVHVAHEFRAFYGTSVGEFVQTRRIARACELLLSSNISIGALACTLGYYDQAHFTRLFKARIGSSPGKFRSLAR